MLQMLPVSGLFRRAIFFLSTSVMVVISPSISSRLPPTVILAMRKGTMTFISGNDDIVVYLQPIRAQNTSPIHNDASSAAGLQTTPSPSQCDGAQVPLLGLPSRTTIHGNSEYVTACGIAPSNTRNAIRAYISSTVPLNEQPHRMASDYPLARLSTYFSSLLGSILQS